MEIWSRIDPDYRYVVYEDELRQFEEEVDWLPSDFWDGLDANNDGVVSAQEACFKAGYWTLKCMELPNEKWVDSDYKETWIDWLVGWYKVGRDKNEIVTIADIRSAFPSSYTDT